MDEISLRKFPYPYKAMLSICSDIDSTDVDSFLGIHRHVNSRLGLEMGDSFWMYMAEGAPERAFSYFQNQCDKETSEAQIIRTLCHSGHIDCIHGYGNFSAVGGFDRVLAKKAVDELRRLGIRVETWINHGDAFNTQNIRVGLGDCPGQKEYHTDITLEYGIRFIWDGELTSFIGQDRHLRLRDTYFTREVVRNPISFVKNLAKVIAKICMFHPILNHENNRLVNVSQLRDGRKVYTFKRYGFWSKARSEDLADLISKARLSELLRNRGYMVVYVHLGKRSNAGIFKKEAQLVLQELKNFYESGQLLVTTTSKLLRYNVNHRFLQWNSVAHGSHTDIVIEGVENEVENRQDLGEEELQGITFYVRKPENIRILSGDRPLHIVINPPDYTGQTSISIPWVSLRPPELLVKEAAFG